MGHMINRQSQTFSCNSGNNCTRNRLNCTWLCLVQLAAAHAELHSKVCDYLYKLCRHNSHTHYTWISVQAYIVTVPAVDTVMDSIREVNERSPPVLSNLTITGPSFSLTVTSNTVIWGTAYRLSVLVQ